jgi:LPPG:FO 2-phospho-L-lactate transferase
MVAAVSPIVGGKAIKGPAAKMYRELGIEPSALAVARHYRGLVDHFVMDQVDAEAVHQVEETGARVLVTDTVMKSDSDRARLAAEILAFAQTSAGG